MRGVEPIALSPMMFDVPHAESCPANYAGPGLGREMIMADLLIGSGRHPTHSRRSQQTDALMVLACNATFENSELLARCDRTASVGVVYAACCCSATAMLMNSAMPERVG
jgi:hypothetical protein